MKSFSLSFCLLLLTAIGFAQPTIDTAIIPAFGDSIHLIRCQAADFLENQNGANQTWDFSGLNPVTDDPDYYFKFLDPQNAPHIDRYPDSDIAAQNADGQFIYYQLNGSTIETIGAVANDPTFGDVFGDYNNAETEEIFPIAFNNSWSDIFDGTNVAGIFSTPFNGTIDGLVDAYGTLILPSGTFQNVLRIKEDRVYQITGAPTQTSTFYRYLSADQRLWLLSMESFPTAPPIIFYRDSPDVISSTQNPNAWAAQIKLSPNPVSSGQTFELYTTDQPIQKLQLLNGLGQIVQEYAQQTFASNDRIVLSVSNQLAPGTYYLKGQNAQAVFVKAIQIIQ